MADAADSFVALPNQGLVYVLNEGVTEAGSTRSVAVLTVPPKAIWISVLSPPLSRRLCLWVVLEPTVLCGAGQAPRRIPRHVPFVDLELVN
jgi:hypothetical protein